MDVQMQRRFLSDFYAYYHELEDQLLQMSAYISFESDNSGVYSNTLLSLLQSIGSEIDVCGKVIAESLDNQANLDGAGILKWGYCFQQVISSIDSTSVSTPIEATYFPWAFWKIEVYKRKDGSPGYRYANIDGAKCESPDWWRAYNKVKHRRKSLKEPTKSEYKCANLLNTIHALAGLYVMERSFIGLFDCAIANQVVASKMFQILPSVAR